MKTLTLVTPHFHPESGAAAKRSTAIARHLTEDGWSVRVITNLPHYPQDSIYDGFDRAAALISTEEGVEVIRLRPWIVPRSSLPLRLLSESLFSLKAFGQLLGRRTDVVLCSSPYMFLGPAGLLASRLTGQKFAWEVRDLTWEYMRASGKRSFGLDLVLTELMKQTARSSDALIVVTPGQLAHFGRLPSKAQVVPNGVSRETLDELGSLSDETGGGPRVLYAGLLGLPQGLSVLVEAARQLPGVRFDFVGDGAERPDLERLAQGLENVEFHGFVPWEKLKAFYARSDVLVAHLRNDPAFEVAQPSKLWEYMSTGKPVVFGGAGEAAELITKYEAGIVVPPENHVRLAEAIKILIESPEEACAVGARGREFVSVHRNRETLLNALSVTLSSLLPGLASERTQRTES